MSHVYCITTLENVREVINLPFSLVSMDSFSHGAWWRHQIGTFFALLAFVLGIHRSPEYSPHKGQWSGALIFFICAWINAWVNICEAGDVRRHRAHYDVIVMDFALACNSVMYVICCENAVSMIYDSIIVVILYANQIIFNDLKIPSMNILLLL